MRPPLVFPLVSLCAICALAQTARWIDVPFVQQPEEGCGAATIAMVMQYWRGQPADLVQIQQALFSQRGHGIYASDMQRYLEQNGFQTFALAADEAALEHHIELGRPLIVALKPSSGPRLHYVVLVGVDPANRVLLVNDPAQRKLMKVDARAFEHQWKATGNWTLLAVPRSGAP